MRQENRPDVRAALARGVDDEGGLEVGVDHDGVVRVIVHNQIRVGAEPAVSRDLDANGHLSGRFAGYRVHVFHAFELFHQARELGQRVDLYGR